MGTILLVQFWRGLSIQGLKIEEQRKEDKEDKSSSSASKDIKLDKELQGSFRYVVPVPAPASPPPSQPGID